MSDERTNKRYLNLAARVASRAFGHAEPNPLVGAVIVQCGMVIGVGHHRRFGELHAERDAIANCRSRGNDPRGATLYCTLEPCSHHGKQPPCTEAIIQAGIQHVVIASRDPHTLSSGGWEQLQAAGITVELSGASQNAALISDPFLHRIRTNRPWVIAKWAQTLDGRIATRTGESQWISNARCRARVHRLRAKVDAVMIGIGTALSDDPQLTARDCRSVRRVAKRVILDTAGRLPRDSKLAQTADQIPTIVYTRDPMRFSGSSLIAEQADLNGDHLDIDACLQHMHAQHGISTVLSESGPRLLGGLLEHQLVNEAIVHVAPGVIADASAKPVAVGRDVPSLAAMRRFELIRTKRIGHDVELHYRAAASPC
ncbi:MAG: bifunctional diaminohydroxyphosphoribosylaminopyrimidine deaminase/5-amino-6-(5-phosphoribosylamino)uracil reductase RibD [Phycisphaerales bacterium]